MEDRGWLMTAAQKWLLAALFGAVLAFGVLAIGPETQPPPASGARARFHTVAEEAIGIGFRRFIVVIEDRDTGCQYLVVDSHEPVPRLSEAAMPRGCREADF